MGFQAVARDITRRKRAEEALERERRQLRDVVAHAPVAMAILDGEGTPWPTASSGSISGA